MSTEVTWQTNTTSSEQTERLAEALGRNLKGGEVIELISDLGGGKTTFVRGLVRGMHSTDKVTSPTFTVSKVYKAGDLEVHHFDFYRLHEPGVIAGELAEVAGDPGAVVVIEWADIVQDALPANRLSVTIAQTPAGDRTLTFKAPESFKNLIEAVQHADS